MNSKKIESNHGVVKVLNELRLSQNEKKTSTIDTYIQSSDPKVSNENHIIEIDPTSIIRWEHKDRPNNELDGIDDLASTFKSIGQQQPCIVRPTKSKGVYELIVGERRWEAAKLSRCKLKILVKDIDNKTAALVQAIENEKRVDLSDFAKGKSYSEKIKLGFISQKDIVEILGISKQQVTRLLSFDNIPQILIDDINDFRKVSARTAYEISRLAKKGDIYINLILKQAAKIRSGKLGANKLILEIEKELLINPERTHNSRKIFSNNIHLFTVTNNKNNMYTIKISKELANSFKENKENIIEDLKKWLAPKK